MKYIMFEVTQGDLKRKVPIIFPSTLVHSEVAKALCKISGLSSRIVGAGELTIRTTGCHGKSTTLKIGSKSDDTKIINTYDYSFGIENVMTDEIDKMLSKLFEQQAALTKIFGGEDCNAKKT